MQIMSMNPINKDTLVDMLRIKGEVFIQSLQLEKYRTVQICNEPYLTPNFSLPLPISDQFRVVNSLNVSKNPVLPELMYGNLGMVHYQKNSGNEAYLFIEVGADELLVITF